MKMLWLLVKRTVREYGDDNCSHMAAAISYYVLFSIIPLAIFLISIFGLIVRDEGLQEDVAAEIVDFFNVESGVPKLELDRDAVVERYGAEALTEIDEALADLSEPATEELAAVVRKLADNEVVFQLDKEAISSTYGTQGLEEIEEALNDEHLEQQRAEELAAALKRGESVVVAGRTLGPDELSVRESVGVAGRELGPDELSVHPDNVVIDTIQGVSDVSGALTIVGLVGMAWSASAMFGAIRKSLNIAWDTEVHRPVVQQKLTDLGMVFGLGLLLGLSVAGTAALRTLQTLSDETLGPLSEGTGFFWAVLPLFLPAIFSFTVFMLIYRYVPNAPSSYRDVWPGALLATVLFELLKNAFAVYIANFNSYAGAYGVLGGLLLFLLWTYLTSNILLIGAELASEYPRVLRGDYDEETPAEPQAKRPASETVRRAVQGLFVHPSDEPEEPTPTDDDEAPG